MHDTDSCVLFPEGMHTTSRGRHLIGRGIGASARVDGRHTGPARCSQSCTDVGHSATEKEPPRSCAGPLRPLARLWPLAPWCLSSSARQHPGHGLQLDPDFFCDTVTEVSGSNEPWTRYISGLRFTSLGLAFCFFPFVIHSQLRWSPRFFDLFMLLRGLLIQIPTFSLSCRPPYPSREFVLPYPPRGWRGIQPAARIENGRRLQ